MTSEALMAGYARYTTAAELSTAQTSAPELSIALSAVIIDTIIDASAASSAACIRFSASAVGTSLLAHC